MFLLIILLADGYVPLQGVRIELSATEIAWYTHISRVGIGRVLGSDAISQGERIISTAGWLLVHGHSLSCVLLINSADVTVAAPGLR